MANVDMSTKPRKWDAMREVARGLGCLVEKRQYTYIDKIGDALTPEIAIKALKDALRALRSMKAAEEGASIYIPSMEAVEQVIKAIEQDIENAVILATLALSSSCTHSSPSETGVEGGER